MAESKRVRAERHKAILTTLNAPGGRARSNADIAAELGCGKQSVAYVRSTHPTPEALERSMKMLDSVFPGIYQWHVGARSIAEIGEHAVKVAAGVNSPNFGYMGIEED